MGIFDIFKDKAVKKTWKRLDDDHIVGATSGVDIAKDEAYVLVRVTEMYLKDARRLWKKFYPMLHGFTEYVGEEEHSIVGPGQLRELGDANLDRVQNFNHRIAGPIAYLGDDLDVLVGLYSVPGDDAAEALLETLNTVADLAALPIGAAGQVATAVKSGVEKVLGLDEASLQLGVRDSFYPVNNPLRSGFHVAVDAPESEIDFGRLWLRNGRLVTGDTAEAAVPYDAHDYLVLEIERRTERDDWASLGGLAEFNNRIQAVLRDADLSVDEVKTKLNEILPQLMTALRSHRKLIAADKKKIAFNLKKNLEEQIEDRETPFFEGIGLEKSERPAFDFIDIPDRLDPDDEEMLEAARVALESDTL